MSASMGTVPASQNTASSSPKMFEEEQKSNKSDSELSLGPNEQAEKEDDGSLSKQTQELIGSTESSVVAGETESKGPVVQILSLSVLSPGRPDVVLTVPFPATTPKATLFTLKQGSKYRMKYHFTVSNKSVNGLTNIYTVWKAGIRVHQNKRRVGTFSPRQEPYTYELEEDTTPTGFFLRGSFLVRSQFVDDDGNCYLDTTYYFDIRKDWGARENC